MPITTEDTGFAKDCILGVLRASAVKKPTARTGIQAAVTPTCDTAH